MRKVFPFVLVLFFAGWICQLNSCAVIVPPGGGPRDTLAPVLVQAVPVDSTLNFKAKSVVLTFDEYVQVQDIFTSLIVSPVPKGLPNIKGKLRSVTIDIKDTLEPNTTYSYDFGNAIQDVNEGNPARNFTYVFSTGDHLDTESITGQVLLAQDGTVDSTLLVALYQNLSDTAVLKTGPRYYTRLDSAGHFAFHFLPKADFNLFVVENSYMKNYGDSTSRFAFMDSTISTKRDSINNGLELFAFRAFPIVEEGKKPAVLNARQIAKRKEEAAKKPLLVATSLDEGKQGLLKPFQFVFNKPLKTFDPGVIKLTDTNYAPVPDYRIIHDSLDTTNRSFFIQKDWTPDQGQDFVFIIPPTVGTDSFDVKMAKADTIPFQVKTEHDYATLQFTFPDVDSSRNPVLLILSEDKILDSVALDANKQVRIERFEPGDYNLRILYDTNGDLQWTPGNYEQKRQPEIGVNIKKKFTFIADTENQWDIHLKANPNGQPDNPYQL